MGDTIEELRKKRDALNRDRKDLESRQSRFIQWYPTATKELELITTQLGVVNGELKRIGKELERVER